MNRLFQDPTKHILIVLADPTESPVTGWPIGFWWAELTHAWLTFRDAGYKMTICSPNGGKLMGDIWSDPENDSGYSAWDIVSQGFIKGPQTKDLLNDVPALGSLNLADYDAIYLAGGQSPMVTWADHDELHRTVATFYESGKILGVVCHGTCVLLKTRLSNGDLLVKGKTWTGFANSEERYSEQAAGQRIQPFWIEDEARNIEDSNFIVQGMLSAHAVRDENLITGQQQFSGSAVAELMIEALGK